MINEEKKVMNRKIKEAESGELMIETTIVLIMTIFIMLFILSLGFYFYQSTIYGIIANETITEISDTYKFNGAVEADNITEDDLKNLNYFRLVKNWIGITTNDKYKKTAEDLISDRTKASSLSLKKNNEIRDVILDVESDKYGRNHLVLTIESKAEIFLGGALEFFGFDSDLEITTVAVGECYDLSAHMNTIRYIKLLDSLTDDNRASELIGKFKSTIDNIKGFLHW